MGSSILGGFEERELHGNLWLNGEYVMTTLSVRANAFLAWTKLVSEKKEQTRYLYLEDVVGVETSVLSKNRFIVYAFERCVLKSRSSNRESSNIRERQVFLFACNSVTECNNFVDAMRSILSRVPIGVSARWFRLRVIINPYGGSGRALSIWNSVKEMFEIAQIETTIIVTTHRNHALEIAETIELERIDGIICVSGDGMLFEVINGLMKRRDWERAIQTPLGIIPAGSGNGLAASIGAVEPLVAAFYIVKGKSRPLDLWSVIHNENQTRSFAFLSVTWGLIADIDYESEKMRFLGSLRFTLSGLKKLLETTKSHRAKLSFLPLDSDFRKSMTTCSSQSCSKCISFSIPTQSPRIGQIPIIDVQSSVNRNDQVCFYGEPSLTYIGQGDIESKPSDPWVTVEGEFSFLIMTNVPKLGEAVHVGKYAHLSDGSIDLIYIVNRKLTKSRLGKLLMGLEDGSFLDMDEIEYRKVKAVILQPDIPFFQQDRPLSMESQHFIGSEFSSSSTLPSIDSSSGHLMLDGEKLNIGCLKIEVHQGLAKIFFGK